MAPEEMKVTHSLTAAVRRGIVLALVLMGLSAAPALATTLTFDGAAATSDWNTAGNWAPNHNVLPTASDDVVISGQAVTISAANATASSVSLSNVALTIGSTRTLTSATVTVNSGLLRGDGTITGNVTNSGGTVSPGASNGAIGTLTVNGGVSQSGSGQLTLDVNGTGSGQYDQLIVSGTVGAGGFLNLQGTYTPTGGETVPVISTGAGITSTFGIVGSKASSWTPQYQAHALNLVGVTAGAGTISGTVRDGNVGGTPVLAGICVQAIPTALSTPPPVVQSDVNGSYSMSVTAANGPWTVKFFDCQQGGTGSRTDAIQFYNDKGTSSSANTVAVTQGATTTNVNATMTAAVTISGHVYSGAGTSTPLQHACVFVTDPTDENDTVTTATRTAADGSYSVPGLLSGASYKLRFIAVTAGCANVNEVSQYYNAKGTFATADAVTAPSSAIDGHLVAAGSIGGTVTDASTHQPVQNICVHAFDATTGVDASAGFSAANGTYTIPGLPAGASYKVSFTDCFPVAAYITQWFNNKSDQASANSVAVTVGQTSPGVDAAMSQAGYVTNPPDTSAPAITITTPVDGAHYAQGQVVPANYACTDPDGAADVATCAGPVAVGSSIDNGTVGVHAFTVAASDHAGNKSALTVHYTVAPNAGGGTGGGGNGGGGAGGNVAATVSALGASPSSFAAADAGASIARKTGTTISYRYSRAGTTTFTVLQSGLGVKKGHSCVKPRKGKHGKRCTRYVSVGSFSRNDMAGPNSFHFTGRVGGRKLKPGRYTLSVVLSANGNTGLPTVIAFRVIK